MRFQRLLILALIIILLLGLGEAAAAWVVRNDASDMILVAPGRDNFVLLVPDTLGSAEPSVGTPMTDATHWVPSSSFPFLEREDYHRNLLHLAPSASVETPAGTIHSASATHLRVAFVGDTGTTADTARVLDQVAAQKPDIIVHVGDISYADQDEGTWDAWYGLVHAHVPTTPIAYATGNHDLQDWAARDEMSLLRGNSAYYSFDAGPVHFIVLDGNNVNDAQAAWLKADLANARAAGTSWIIPVEHQPWYSSGTTHGSSMAARDAFASQFAAAGVKLAVAGHEHNYERTTPIDGVTYVVTGGGCESLYDDLDAAQLWSAKHDATYEFVLVDFTPSSGSAKTIDANAQLLDSFTV